MGKAIDMDPEGLAEHIGKQASGFIQSESHRDLLDIVDSLRSSGVSHYVDLPQIIVCGSQSCGKSSTLESLSGIAFPTGEGLCTRFATELILRRGPKAEITVHIQPSASRSEADRVKLAAFSEKTAGEHDFPKIVEAAKEEMGLAGAGPGARGFSSDVLRIESTSPTAPNLTLVDLPGLFSAADKNQSEDDVTLVQNLVISYMKQRRSIILAVCSADNDFNNQPVTKFAREIDPSNTRTLGLITKPDKVEPGSKSEENWVEMAQNENVKLRLGWHVLRNNGQATSKRAGGKGDEGEASFFDRSAWRVLDDSQLGAEALRERLRQALWTQIKEGLPDVKSEVQSGIKDSEFKLRQLGKARSSKKEKHTYLNKISTRLTKMVQASIDGVGLTQYADKMNKDGHALEIVEDGAAPCPRKLSSYMERSAYLTVVKELMVECRGRELPGTFNPLVVGDLFSRQCKPWVPITRKHVQHVHGAAVVTFDKMVTEICDKNTQSRLMRDFIQPSLHKLRKDLTEKLDELLLPHLTIHPITYHDYLTKSVQETQTKRHKRKFDSMSQEACSLTAETARAGQTYNVDVGTWLKKLRTGTEPNVEEYSASLAADVAAAYYEVALKKFTDDVSVNAVEARLVQRLPQVFCPDVVWDLKDEDIEALGSEDDTTVQRRAELKKKLDILETGLKALDSFTARSGVNGE